MDQRLETVTFAAGCFWGVEDIFRGVKGVIDVIAGYSGGQTENPTYEKVCSGTTGHAESVQIQYDPAVVSYEKLLKVFWDMHDPTTLNRQGPDIGSQYRSIIFYHSLEQKVLAEKSKDELNHSDKFQDPIITEILPASTFYKAEEYHQQYFQKNKDAKHC